MRHGYSIGMVGACIVAGFCGPVMAQDLTCSLSTGLGADYEGYWSVRTACWDLSVTTPTPGATVRIIEAGAYGGGLYISQANTSVVVDPGVTGEVRIIGVAGEGNTIHTDTGASNFHLGGVSASNRMVLQGSGDDNAHLWACRGGSPHIENVNFVGTDTTLDQNASSVNDNTGIVINGYDSFDGGVIENCDFTLTGQFAANMAIWRGGVGTAATVFKNCVFDASAGVDVRGLWKDIFWPSTGDLRFEDCDFYGGAPHYCFTNEVYFLRCTFTDPNFRVVSCYDDGGFWATNTAGGALTYDDCRIYGLFDRTFHVHSASGFTLTFKNMLISDADLYSHGGTLGDFLNISDGTVNFEDCLMNGAVTWSWPELQRPGATLTVNIRRCVMMNAHRNFLAPDSAMTRTFNISDTVIYGRAGASQNNLFDFHTGGTSTVTLTHVTMMGADPAGGTTLGDALMQVNAGSNITARYCIFDSRGVANTAAFSGTPGALDTNYSIWWNGTDAGYGGALGAHDVAADPLIETDGHISNAKAMSPALGAAIGSTSTMDFEGDARPLGDPVPDIGADESAWLAGEDTDGDLMPDSWEGLYGLDRLNPADGDLDPDFDGATNTEEYLRGTNPLEPDDDFDGDGMSDTWEVSYFGNLDQTGDGDFDGDGATDLQEYQDGTDPTNPANRMPAVAIAGLAVLTLGLALASARSRR